MDILGVSFGIFTGMSLCIDSGISFVSSSRISTQGFLKILARYSPGMYAEISQAISAGALIGIGPDISPELFSAPMYFSLNFIWNINRCFFRYFNRMIHFFRNSSSDFFGDCKRIFLKFLKGFIRELL